MDEEFDFDELEKALDTQKILFEKMAELMAPLYRAFRAQGLSAHEAAVLTAAYFTQTMPIDAIGPQEGS